MKEKYARFSRLLKNSSFIKAKSLTTLGFSFDFPLQYNKDENVHRFAPKGELLEREREF